MIKHKRVLSVALALPILLTGCGGGSFNDLQAFMEETRARPAGNIEPLPRFAPYEAFTYSATSLRSPFQPPIRIDLAQRERGSQDLKPDEDRVKQFLEGFNIEGFEMVGVLSNQAGAVVGFHYGNAARIAQSKITATLAKLILHSRQINGDTRGLINRVAFRG